MIINNFALKLMKARISFFPEQLEIKPMDYKVAKSTI